MSRVSSIRVQTLDGTWETIGVDRYPGLFAGGINPTADLSGPAAFSFTLQRNPELAQIDLLAWTPCELEADGTVVWEGRIRETPGTHGAQRGIAVSAEGWQGHWDDGVLEHTYLHQDLSAWVDTRSMVGASLTTLVAAPQVMQANGSVALMIPAGTVMPAHSAVSITLDMGEYGGSAYGIAFDAVVSGGTASGSLQRYARTANQADWNTATLILDTAGSGATFAAGTYTNLGGLFSGGTNGYRYVNIIVFTSAGATISSTVDFSFQISRIVVCGDDSSYVQFGASGNPGSSLIGIGNLRASDVITDAAAACAPMLTADPLSPAYVDEVLGDSPQSYWRLGFTPAPADRIINSNDPRTVDLGTFNNALFFFGASPHVTNVPGLLIDDPANDGAVAFDGTSSATATGQNPQTYTSASGTIEALVSPSNPTAGNQEIIRFNQGMGLRINASHQWEFIVFIGGGYTLYAATGFGTITANATYHLIASYETGPGTAYMLVNGVSQTLTKTILAGTGSGPLTAPTGVDIANFLGTEFWNGTIDEIAIYGNSLDVNTGQNHYQAAISRRYGTVQRSQYKIPSYAPSGAKTFRDHAQAVNDLHNWRLKMLPGRRLMFQPQPTSVALRATGSLEFQEAAANTGTDVYNSCVVEAADATGAPIRAFVAAGHVFPDAPTVSTDVPQPSNPGFEVDTTGWTTPIATNGTFARSTSRSHSGVGAGFFNMGAPSTVQITTTVNGQFFRGLTYALTGWVNPSYFIGPFQLALNVYLGVLPEDLVQVTLQTPAGTFPSDTWSPFTVRWSPIKTVSSAQIFLRADTFGGGGTAQVWWDDIALSRLIPTLLDRRGLVRTKILSAQSAIDKVTATTLATAFLKNNSSLPFRGSFTATKPDDVLLQPGDIPVPQAQLLLHTNELIRLPLIDPNTGDIGRDGKIALVTYDDSTDVAQVTIDDDRTSFTALLNRMAVTSAARGI